MNQQLLAEIARAIFSGQGTVHVSGRDVSIGRTERAGLRRVEFRDGNDIVTVIEQNPTKHSEWAKLARNGHQVAQVKVNDSYKAVVVDGQVKAYGD